MWSWSSVVGVLAIVTWPYTFTASRCMTFQRSCSTSRAEPSRCPRLVGATSYSTCAYVASRETTQSRLPATTCIPQVWDAENVITEPDGKCSLLFTIY